jgi:hypothetical protein
MMTAVVDYRKKSHHAMVAQLMSIKCRTEAVPEADDGKRPRVADDTIEEGGETDRHSDLETVL